MLFFTCSVVLAVTGVVALTDEEVIRRFSAIEDIGKRYHSEITAMKSELKSQRVLIQKQEKQIQSMQRQINTLKSENKDGCATDKSQDVIRRASPSESVIRKLMKENRIRSKTALSGRGIVKKTATEGVAFTAYLDHAVDFGKEQTIKFNRVITNEGNGYSVYTGIFTCPLSGMYLFTLEIEEKGIRADLVADIVVNSQRLVDAVVDPYHDNQDIMGGNTVVIRLNQGDAVWVSARVAGTHADSYDSYRRTTFTGFYLFA